MGRNSIRFFTFRGGWVCGQERRSDVWALGKPFVYSVPEKAEYKGVNALLSGNIQRHHDSHNVMTGHLYRFANCLVMILIKMFPFCVDPAFGSLRLYHLVIDQ